jgi:hypothetical protein
MLGKLAPGDVVTVTRIDRLWITVTVYSTSHGSCAGRAVSGSTRGFGPGLRGAKRQAEPALEHRGPFRPPQRMADGGDPLNRVVAAAAGIARRAAKSEISARNGATVVNSSSSPASCARVLDHGQRGTAHQPRDHRIERDVPRRRQQTRLVHHHRAKATLEQMVRPSEPMLIAAV